MNIADMKGKHLAAVQDHLRSLSVLYPGIDEDQDQMLVRLAMLHHDEDPTNIGRANELLESDGAAYVAYCNPIIDLNGRTAKATPAADGTYLSVVLPVDGRTVLIKPLTGRQWRMALSDTQRMSRTAVMAGLEVAECQEMAMLDYLTIEEATTPFLSQILAALMTGTDSLPSSSVEEQDSPE